MELKRAQPRMALNSYKKLIKYYICKATLFMKVAFLIISGGTPGALILKIDDAQKERKRNRF